LEQQIKKKYLDEIPRIKKSVEDAQNYFKDNNRRFHQSREFLYKSTLTEDDRANLKAQGKPEVEVNIIEPMVSRQCGEWSKQTPDMTVRSKNDEINPEQPKIVEGYLRCILSDSDAQEIQIEIHKEIMSGGFSVLEVVTEYESDTSLNQVIRLQKPFDSTLCGFDPMARKPSKHDGNFCYKLTPMLQSQAKEEFPNVNFEQVKSESIFMTESDDFRWMYTDNQRDIVLIADYFEKKYENVKFVMYEDPQVPDKVKTVPIEKYEAMIQEWKSFGLPPQVLQERTRKVPKIYRYRFIGDQIIEEPIKTNFRFLPLVFFDGNSAVLKGKQRTRSYIHNTFDAQRIKNLAASSFVNDMENMRQSDIFVAKKALPTEPEFKLSWLNPQKATAPFVYNSGEGIPEPRVERRGDINAQTMQIYQMFDTSVQTVLGNYDPQIGINEKDLSGVAIEEGATQSNGAAMPYVVNYMSSWNHTARIIADLLPKYCNTLTTLPVMLPNGQKTYIRINDAEIPESKLTYDSDDLEVVIKAGVNFEIQRNRAFETIIKLMTVSEAFRAMMEQQGLPILIDNIDIRGKDQLKQMAERFLAMNMQKTQNQPNLAEQDMQLKAQKVMNESKKIDQDGYFKNKDLELKKMDTAIHAMDLERTALIESAKVRNEADKTQAENIRTHANLAMTFAEKLGKHSLDTSKHALEIHKVISAPQAQTVTA
jgi:hypothetical protein